MLPTITIIGRPNVGKSTLFNRIIGRKRAIVDDTPGVTRDWKEENTYIYGRKFRVIDTAGLEKAESKSLEALMMKQTDNAMNEADVMVFVVDGVAGITPKDEIFAREIRKKAKPVILVVNKCEKKSASTEDFYRLGFGEPYAISAEHNLGTEDLYRAILKTVPRQKNEPVEDEEENEKRIQIAIIGRPNAGKSTILNKILGQERVIASPVAGTTRDAISIDWEYKGHKLRLIDTAGMRRRANISEQLEKFSVSDAVHAIKFAHVVVLVSDSSEILESQDLKMAALTISEGRALVLAVNKWDLVKDKAAFSEELDYQVRKHMTDVVGLPITKFSAINDKSLDNLLDTALEAYRRWNTRVSTAKLNDWLSYLLEHHPPPINKGRRIKIRYITQTKSRPPTFMLACSQPDALADSYVKYIVNDLRKTFDMPGVPIRVLLPQKDNPYKDKE